MFQFLSDAEVAAILKFAEKQQFNHGDMWDEGEVTRKKGAVGVQARF